MPTQNSELSSLESRVKTVCMYESHRELALGAARAAFIIVERFTWAMHRIGNVAAFLVPKAALVN